MVGQLLCSPRWAQVVTVGRREVPVPPQYTGWEGGKLKQVVVDIWNGIQNFFGGFNSVLGTALGGGQKVK